MSDNNNVLIAALAIGAYMYMKRNQVGGYPKAQGGYTGAVPSMPGSAGTGTNQVATGALVGFLRNIAGSFQAPYATPNVPPQVTGAVQDVADWYTGGSAAMDGGDIIDNIMF
jgi:hypothetical protein